MPSGRFPGPIDVVAHSVGGFLLGPAPSNHLIRRVFTMGAQYAYWPDYAAGTKLRMVAKWHVAMPLITALFGYFPGKRLGRTEDTPKGVVRDWAFSRQTFRRHLAGPLHPPAAPTSTRPVRRSPPSPAPTLADERGGR